MEMEISSLQQQVMATNQSMEESMLSKKQQEKKVRPQQDQALKCPRCESTNTKFCYYNNYSLSQPRYFCKGCRRYWTQGGSLRKVPVGGGCRKNKKQTPNSSKNKPQDHDRALPMINPNIDHLLPTLSYDPTDLTLTFARLHNQQAQNPNPNGEGFLDILRNGFLGSTNYTNGFNNLCDFDGGVLPLMSSGASTTIVEDNGEGRCKALDINGGEQWQLSDENNKNNSTDVDVGSSRDYWNGDGPSYWHGLINSSLM